MADTVVKTERRDVSFATFAYLPKSGHWFKAAKKSVNDSKQERTS